MMKNNIQKLNRFIELLRGGTICLRQYGFLYTLKLCVKKLIKRLRKKFGWAPKITIIVPVYNVEAYLRPCLDSCVNQTMEEIEILCINDGSTDRSGKILREYAKKDRRIKIVNKRNGGLSSARNAGLDRFRGEVVMFLDSDDYLSLNACERVWEEMQKQPTDIVIFGTDIFPAVPKAPDWYFRTLNVADHRYSKPGAAVLFWEHCSKPFVWRQAFSGKLLRENHARFHEDVKYGEDIAFQMEYIPHGENFAFISDKLYHYLWHREGSLMNLYDSQWDERLYQHLQFIGYVTEYWQKQGWLQIWGMEYTRWLLQFFVQNCTSPNTKNPQKHMGTLVNLLETFNLVKHLDEMTAKNKILADVVRTFM